MAKDEFRKLESSTRIALWAVANLHPSVTKAFIPHYYRVLPRHSGAKLYILIAFEYGRRPEVTHDRMAESQL